MWIDASWNLNYTNSTGNDEEADFGGLHELINSNSVPYIGELTVFDTALRLGSFFGYSPQVVYLHRGAAKGYMALMHKIAPYSIPATDFPDPLCGLEPYQIENFLCIFKNCFGDDQFHPVKIRC